MRLLARGPVQVYVWRRGTPKRNGRLRDCNGVEIRVRSGEFWWHGSATWREIARGWGRSKGQAEVTVYRTLEATGRRDLGYRKRFVRVVYGTGGQGAGAGRGGTTK